MSEAPSIIKRSQLAEYLNITPIANEPDWQRIGFGVEDKSTDYNIETSDSQFIDEDSPNSSIRSYGNTSEFDLQAAQNVPLFTYLDGLRINRSTYGEADTEYLEVRLYEPVEGKPNTFAATRSKVAVGVSSIGAAATDPLTLSVTINGKGDPEQGIFDYTTKTFTPAGDVTPTQPENP